MYSIDTSVLAATRLRFRRPWQMLMTAVAFWRLYRKARLAPGFIRGDVGMIDLHTLLNVSVWRDRESMLAWSGSAPHVHAVQSTYGQMAEVWSTEWAFFSQRGTAEEWTGRVSLGTERAHPREHVGAR